MRLACYGSGCPASKDGTIFDSAEAALGHENNWHGGGQTCWPPGWFKPLNYDDTGHPGNRPVRDDSGFRPRPDFCSTCHRAAEQCLTSSCGLLTS